MYHASQVEEIYKEMQALKKLAHPNIIKLFHAFLWKNNVVLIMEYVPNGDLAKYVRSKANPPGLSECEAREIFLQLLTAVEHCHTRGVIHRDLKPGNILLAQTADKQQIKVRRCDTVVQLIDFGIASSNVSLEMDKKRVGTLQYMAPEVLALSKGAISPALDIWAMGIVLYFLVFASVPFKGFDKRLNPS